MLVGYMRVSSDGDRQMTAVQQDALLTAGIDDRHLIQDKTSGSRLACPPLTVSVLITGRIPSEMPSKLLDFNIPQRSAKDNRQQKSPDFSGPFVLIRTLPEY